jgi:hypothetical protein
LESFNHLREVAHVVQRIIASHAEIEERFFKANAIGLIPFEEMLEVIERALSTFMEFLQLLLQMLKRLFS